ncbi:MAG: TolC family protein [Planctomycetes bacterium]|nr:TolC family protein [Planctomycetota bacterium]
MPTATQSLPSEERLSPQRRQEVYVLSARKLIPIAFDLQPDIKSSYQRFKSEAARYDFFVVSRDSLTPIFRTSNDFGESRGDETVTRDRGHTVEFAVEKLFFDTTRLDVGVGYQTDVEDDATGNHPFVSADLRYPLGASREKLERTSEEIFRRNELNDAQLDYIQEVRSRLQRALFRFHEVVRLEDTVQTLGEWKDDLVALRQRLEGSGVENVTSDLSRVDAEVTRVNSTLRNESGRYRVDVARLKSLCGIPLYARTEIVDEPFNPFVGATHQDLFRMSIDTDPEILTLRNEVRNAEVQLDLARRGQWDVALLLGGESALEGRGESDTASDWSINVGFEVSLVDPRVTGSLIRQSQANILRFSEAIAARENDIFVDTLEPIIRIETLGASRDELRANLPRFEQDYQSGIDAYFAGTLNIDDLLKRRETLWFQQDEIASLTRLVGANVAELCSATGKFFELLDANGKQAQQ